jgi:hypothetical protein
MLCIFYDMFQLLFCSCSCIELEWRLSALICSNLLQSFSLFLFFFIYLFYISNCINTVLHRSNKLFDAGWGRSERDSAIDFFEDDFDVIHIGPWKYDMREEEIAEEAYRLQTQQRKLIEDLQVEKWVIHDSQTNLTTMSGNTLNEPHWLMEERKHAIDAHQNVAIVMAELEDRNEDWPGKKDAQLLLGDGLISFDEYR